ncbi:hypothetical protein PCANC_04722 [Puccinia coronata f. sp. avenae]|uniref:Uncharacterized protein n=1 Tax=Puccinia coronata f. sp. avenae TaxID=200324 RepID=A0A2N5W1R6_9BASI|nr:hypothetical protein PCANC_04722 [Puccinia coronata f. sp. avenae]
MHFFQTTIIAIAVICSISLSITAEDLVRCETDRPVCACTSPAPPAPGRPIRWHVSKCTHQQNLNYFRCEGQDTVSRCCNVDFPAGPLTFEDRMVTGHCVKK